MLRKYLKPDHLSIAARYQTGKEYVKVCFIHYFFKTLSLAMIVYVALNSTAVGEVLPELLARIG